MPDFRDFITEYVKYAETLTDAPKAFHNFSALAILSAIVGSKVYLPAYGGNNLYPNLWIVLLAKSSVYRKSTCLGMASNAIKAVNDDLILPDEWSKERLIQNLAANSQGIFIWNEFASVMAALKRDYMSGATEMLTILYDCPESYKRVLQSAAIKIERPCLSILGASTTEWFCKSFKEHALAGGYLARFLYVAPKEKNGFMAWPQARDQEKQDFLKAILNKISQVKGPADPSNIKEDYEMWLRKHEDSVPDGIMGGFYARLGAYCLKLTMLYQISLNRSLILEKDSLERAIFTIDAAKTYIQDLVTNEFSFTPQQEQLNKVFRIVREQPGISWGLWLQRSNMKARDLRALEQTLIESIRIRKEKKGKTYVYYPAK